MTCIAGVTTGALLLCSVATGATTVVPGQARRADADGNGYPDVGVVVNGHYTSVYAQDAEGDWYWDLGDGRVEGTVGSIADLDPATLTTCDYEVEYRGTFDDTPYLDSGWITNHIRCSGYAGRSETNYLIVSRSDPRWEGDPARAVWGDWEYHVLTESAVGNLLRPENAVGSD